VNEAYSAAWGSVDAPTGGFRASGIGRRHGAEGLLQFTEVQTVAVQRGIAFDLTAPLFGKERVRRLTRRVLRLMHLAKRPF
jgi:succinate-semialdehyde dehydrogenase/glutarate-semialdehyde dehydrogenase